MQPNDASDQVQRVDQVLNGLEQLIADRVAPHAFCIAFTQAATQLLPGGRFYSAHWLASTWLIEPLASDTQSARPVNRPAIRGWLDGLKEQPPTSHTSPPNHRGYFYTSGCTFLLAAQSSPRGVWGALLWQREGELNQLNTNAVFQLLSPLAEVWYNYWQINHSRALETIRAGFNHELMGYGNVTHPDELAFRFVSDLALATGSQRCAIAIQRVRGWRTFKLLAISGLADVKTQRTATLDSLKAMAACEPAQFYSSEDSSSSTHLVLTLNDRESVILQWSNRDALQTSASRLSALWLSALQAWNSHRTDGQSMWSKPTRLRLPSKRWLALVSLFAIAIALWTTRDQQLQLTIECPGRLEPIEQAWVFAPADGRVEHVHVNDRELVGQGQPLVTVVSPSLDLQRQSLASEMETLLQKKLSLDILASANNASTEVEAREARRIAGEILDCELRIEGLKRQREMLAAEAKKLVVHSQIPGRVIGGNLSQTLTQKPVRTGDYLFRLVNEDGAWHLELSLPERELGHIERALIASSGKLPMRFSILGMPGKSYAASIVSIRSAVQLNESQGSVAELLADVEDHDLADVPVGSQVLARIDTGFQPWWFVLARPIIESLQRRGWLE